MRQIISILAVSVLLLSCVTKTKETTTSFENLNVSKTHLDFSNTIIENDTLNYFKFPYMYMGGGVSIGDINNDGLSDIFFTGNLTSNKLYLNKGNLEFEDITEKAHVSGDNRWYTGTTMIDINNDGFLDIYVCVSGKFTTTKNQLYINNGDGTFSEKAKEYGIDDSGTSIQSTFFDYNNDGHIDLFVANYPLVPVSQGNIYYYAKMMDNKLQNSGHLYKNNGDQTFSDVTEEAKVKNFGMTLGIVASDLNNDGWQDLYLSNDFNVPDYLYLNKGDGTFQEVIKKTTNNISMFGMGTDINDFNNDGLQDILQVDMTPNDYKRSKTNMASMNPKSFYEAIDLGLHYQYMQNSLQLNNGIVNNTPHFSNIARMANIATTDWSWGALFADFDNDGWKDIVITNGMKRDVNNNDVLQKHNSQSFFGSTKNLDYLSFPSTPINNYIFKNNKNYTFSKTNKKWNFNYQGFSNGISYADLDNDGDLDLVINNLNDKASLFENKTNQNYIQIQLKGPQHNRLGIGTKVVVETNKGEQTQELTLTRGFQSSIDPKIHFGLGSETTIQKIKVQWPDKKETLISDITANQLLEIEYNEKAILSNLNNDSKKTTKQFKDITKLSGIVFKHQEDDYNDFNYEPLLPHKNSQLGSGIAVGDVNGDSLEDFFVGNASGAKASMHTQNQDGTFTELLGPWKEDFQYEDMDAILFDPDNDGDLDLYVVSGGNNPENKNLLQDRIYINTKDGFIKGTDVLPKNFISGQVVAPGDYNNDHKIDLFVGGRLIPRKYPLPAKSTLLKNNGGKDLDLKFVEANENTIPDLEKMGLVTSAIWDDFDANGTLDLIVTGEWMPLRFFKNNGDTFEEITDNTGLKNTKGWWYALKKVDLDNDGDLDYLAGNLGLNYKYKTSSKQSFEIYANDFDQNNSLDIVLSYQKENTKLPLRGRECSSQQVGAIKNRFQTFESFAEASLEEIYGKKMLEKSFHSIAETFAHHWIENKGNGSFDMHKLPNEVQVSSINRFEVFDYNDDTSPDILALGNLYNSEVETPRNDANIGLILSKNSSNSFNTIMTNESNLVLKGEIRGSAQIQLANKKEKAFLILTNNETLKLLEFSK